MSEIEMDAEWRVLPCFIVLFLDTLTMTTVFCLLENKWRQSGDAISSIWRNGWEMDHVSLENGGEMDRLNLH